VVIVSVVCRFIVFILFMVPVTLADC
jgi:hypothetical protein